MKDGVGPDIAAALHQRRPYPLSDEDLPILNKHALAAEAAETWSLLGPWRTSLRATAFAAMAAAGTTHRVSELLTVAGVAHVVYKGLATAELSGRNWLRRRSDDVDVLVAPNDVSRAESALSQAGWKRSERSRRPSRLYRWTDCEVGWTGPGLTVDLHWRLDSNPRLFRIPATELHQRSITVAIGGMHIPTLNPVDAAVACAVHATREMWFRWRAILDFLGLMEAVDPNEVLEVAREAGAFMSVAVAAAVCQRIGASVPGLPTTRRSEELADWCLTHPLRMRPRDRLAHRQVKWRSCDDLPSAVQGLARSSVGQLLQTPAKRAALRTGTGTSSR